MYCLEKNCREFILATVVREKVNVYPGKCMERCISYFKGDSWILEKLIDTDPLSETKEWNHINQICFFGVLLSNVQYYILNL